MSNPNVQKLGSSPVERPILFSDPMVRAILDGKKTVTRRVIKPQPKAIWGQGIPNSDPNHYCVHAAVSIDDCGRTDQWIKCPYGKPGDRLWVRETFLVGYKYVDDVLVMTDADGYNLDQTVWYRATCDRFDWLDADGYRLDNPPWKPSIHMPRRASRILLEVTDVRVERMQDTSEADIIAEGVTYPVCKDGHALIELGSKFAPATYLTTLDGNSHGELLRAHFASLWDSINFGRGFGWAVNPFVWAVSFKVLEAYK